MNYNTIATWLGQTIVVGIEICLVLGMVALMLWFLAWAPSATARAWNQWYWISAYAIWRGGDKEHAKIRLIQGITQDTEGGELDYFKACQKLYEIRKQPPESEAASE